MVTAETEARWGRQTDSRQWQVTSVSSKTRDKWRSLPATAGPVAVYSYSIWIFTHLKLCLADAIHNCKWVKIIQIWSNGECQLRSFYIQMTWWSEKEGMETEDIGLNIKKQWSNGDSLMFVWYWRRWWKCWKHTVNLNPVRIHSSIHLLFVVMINKKSELVWLISNLISCC